MDPLRSRARGGAGALVSAGAGPAVVAATTGAAAGSDRGGAAALPHESKRTALPPAQAAFLTPISLVDAPRARAIPSSHFATTAGSAAATTTSGARARRNATRATP